MGNGYLYAEGERERERERGGGGGGGRSLVDWLSCPCFTTVIKDEERDNDFRGLEIYCETKYNVCFFVRVPVRKLYCFFQSTTIPLLA